MNYELFKNKTILVFLPHQDDELNTVYGLLYGIKDLAKSIKIIYSTNGNSVVDSKYRIKEGINSLKRIGIKKENIIFLGYSDQIPEADNHLYIDDEWKDHLNNVYTNTPFNNDYHFLKFKEHAKFNKENLVNDIYSILKDERADILFCIDYDSHPDHKALSLCFESALGKLMNEVEYKPIVYKTFAYPTSYKGKGDYDFNNPSTKFICEENSINPMQNPYYNWDERIRFIQPKKARNYLLLKNIYFYGLLEHKSQYIFNRIEKIINSDLIFFERNTNNLLYNSEIITTSGDSKYLNDFMLFDSTNIMNNANDVFDIGYTIISKKDNNKKIIINFKNKVFFDTLKIYTKNINPDICKYIEIKVNEKAIKYQTNFKNNILYLENLDYKNVDKIEIKLILNNNIDFMISEIEIYKKATEKKFGKLIIDDNYVYNYYFEKMPIIDISSNYEYNQLNIEKNKIKNDYIVILKNQNSEIIDTINLKYLNTRRKIFLSFAKKINKISIFLGRVYQKIIKLIRKK